MTKKIYLKLAVFLVAINILFTQNLVATGNIQAVSDTNIEINTTDENIDIENNSSDDSITEEERKQIEELNNIIKELVKSIQSKLKTIDEKIENIRTIEEYKNYPAIRLNVDTPIFGVASVTNSKLKIKQDVSATDIAKGYSIRYIIKNDSIKLPNKYIAGIIVSTKDVKFDENISLNDANTAVIKLMQYSKTVDNVIEFLNNQINKIFKGYIDKNKSEIIAELERKIDNLNEDLLKQDEKLLSLHIILTSEEKKINFEKEIETFNSISKRIKQNEKKIKNILISNEDLVKVQKDVLALESTMIDFSIELDKNLVTANENIDEKQILLAIQEELNTRKDLLDEIVENSIAKKVIKNIVENTDTNSDKSIDSTNIKLEENITNIDGDNKIQTIEEIKKYDIVSKNILESIEEEILKSIEDKVKYYAKNTSDETNLDNKETSSSTSNSGQNNVEDSKELEKVEENKISEEEKQQILNDCVNLYKEFITKENKFYLDNINSTLKNTTSKISDLSKYTKSDILNEMRYIYLELPTSLENYLDSTNLNSIIETKTLSNNFNKELNNLLNVYVKVSKIYDELNIENEKKNA